MKSQLRIQSEIEQKLKPTQSRKVIDNYFLLLNAIIHLIHLIIDVIKLKAKQCSVDIVKMNKHSFLESFSLNNF